jgi:multidrug efflux pump subunit AcrA (membrane-fusion protein)
VVDPATATANVRLALRKTTGVPPIGTTVHVDIVTEVRKGVVTVPPRAIVRDDGKSFVFIAGPDKKAHRREVKVGVSSESAVEIVSGVSAGDNVIVRGHEALPDGAAIRPEEPAKADDKEDGKKDKEESKKEESKDGKSPK